MSRYTGPRVEKMRALGTELPGLSQKKIEKPVLAGAAVATTFETPWLEVDRDGLQATVKSLPDEMAVLFPLEVQLVVEYYTPRL